MSIKIVTDSTSDITLEVARELGITVVPSYVRFGNQVYRDGVDISKDGFYRELINSPFHPVTSEATPEDFAKVYSDCSQKAEGIISIHISSKVSDTYNSARKGKNMMKGKCQIEVIDSQYSSVGLGLMVMAAARLANSGESLRNILEEIYKAVSQIQMLGIVDTMKYLVVGKRVNRAVAALYGILQVKPLLAFEKGEIVRAGLVRTYSRGMDRLCEFVANVPAIRDLAVAYSTVPEWAEELERRLGSILPEKAIYLTQIGAALGAHVGPGALIVAFRRDI